MYNIWPKCIFFVFAISIVNAQDSVIVGYYPSGSINRPGDAYFDIDSIDPFLCTHLNYAFAGLDANNYTVKSLNPELDLNQGNYDKFVALKNINPALKTLLSVGGWGENPIPYSEMSSTPGTRQVFINSAIDLLTTHGFDGLDLDWEYPANRGGAPEDKENFVILLQEMKNAFAPYNMLVTVAVGMTWDVIESAYDIPGVAAAVDFVNLMSYDYHGFTYDNKTQHHSPMYARPAEQGLNATLNLNSSVNIWLENGAPASSLVLGVPFYGKSYTVPNNNGDFDQIASGPGTNATMDYRNICQYVTAVSGWTIEHDNYTVAPHAWMSDQWIGYDDVYSVQYKMQWAKSLGLKGGMTWEISIDDFDNVCGNGVFPLLTAMNDVFRPAINVVYA